MSNDCWEWPKARDNNGYGMVFVDGKLMRAHVVAYIRAVGPVPVNHEVHHTCKNKSCVNPMHLKAVTRREHLLMEPTRLTRSELVVEQITELRSKGYTITQISDELQVSRTTVHRAIHNLHGRDATVK